MNKPKTLGELRNSVWGTPDMWRRTVKDEMRANLVRKLDSSEPIFAGIVGYEDTVIPQVVNAILSKHNMILLGLRGQA
jgi:magnesium chelatase subunit I